MWLTIWARLNKRRLRLCAQSPEHTRASCVIVWVCALLALVLRVFYVSTVSVDSPTSGDAGEYFIYARNIAEHGIFSSSLPGGQAVTPDNYRDPGYPFLVSILMRVSDGQGWYPLLLFVQAVLGAATVALAMLLGRRWMPAPWLGVAGILMAIWPHSVSMTSYILTETLAGFLVVAWLFLLSTAVRMQAFFFAGLIAGTSGLVNAVLLPAAPLVAVVLWASRKLGHVAAAAILAGALLFPALWGARGLGQDHGGTVHTTSLGRATQNLVQGSWPEYHETWRASKLGDSQAQAIQTRINDEISLLHATPRAGFDELWGRLMLDPWKYIGWYASKPALLWGWDIRIGQGDVFVYPVRVSAYYFSAIYQATAAIARGLNPAIFIMAAIFCVATVLRWRITRPAALAIATVLLYVTAVYSVFQSEPRYSIAFRSLEILAATAAVAVLYARARQWLVVSRSDAKNE